VTAGWAPESLEETETGNGAGDAGELSSGRGCDGPGVEDCMKAIDRQV